MKLAALMVVLCAGAGLGVAHAGRSDGERRFLPQRFPIADCSTLRGGGSSLLAVGSGEEEARCLSGKSPRLQLERLS